MSRRVLCGAALALSFAWSSAGAVSATDGQREYDAGHFETARQIWTEIAAGGTGSAAADAELGLGLIYDLGQGIAADPEVAYRHYLRAAAAGVPAAEFNVAVMNDSGTGTPRDAGAAATWYARAAARGHRRAQYNLAQLYRSGQGVPYNPEAAATWFRAAASGNLAAAAAGALDPAIAAQLSPASQPATPRPAVLVAPFDGDRVTRAPDGQIELVWTVPAQPYPTQYFVEVVRSDGAAASEVFASYVERTACLVALPEQPATYFWRVYLTGDGGDSADYIVTEWARFHLG